MRTWFYRTAVVNILKRRPASVLRILVVSVVGTACCLAGFVWGLATWRDIERMQAEVTMDVYFGSKTTDSVIVEARRSISESHMVLSVWRVQAQDVWQSFANDVRLAGDAELQDVIELPRIIRLRVKTEYISPEALARLADGILTAGWVDIIEVAWPKHYVDSLWQRRSDLMIAGLSAGILGLVVFASTILYAFRGELERARHDVAIGHQIGATRWFIAVPHIMVSLVAGTVGVGIAIGGVALVWPHILHATPWLGSVRMNEIVLCGAALVAAGFVVSGMQAMRTVGTAVSFRRRRAD